MGMFDKLGDVSELMKAAKEMQSKMSNAQEHLRSCKVTGEAGAGLVKITMNGVMEPIEVEIDPSILTPEDKDMAQDLVCAALADTMKRVQELAKTQMGKATDGMPIPPGMFGG